MVHWPFIILWREIFSAVCVCVVGCSFLAIPHLFEGQIVDILMGAFGSGGPFFFDGPWPLSRLDQDVGMRTFLQEKISPIMMLLGGRLSTKWTFWPSFYSGVFHFQTHHPFDFQFHSPTRLWFHVFCSLSSVSGFSIEFIRNGADL